MEAWQLYLILKLDAVNTVLLFSAIACWVAALAAAIVAVVHVFEDEAIPDAVTKWIRKGVVLAVVLAGLCIAVPSTKEALTIVALDKLSKDETAIRITENTIKLIDKKLQEYLDELKEK